MRRVRRHLSYANVMATIAVFGVLAGGVAWALDRNQVKSKHIAPGQVKLSDTNDKLRLKCPGGTRYHEGACFERASRAAAQWTAADQNCNDAGRRLPGVSELLGFRREPGIALTGSEWTSDIEFDGNGELVAWDVNEEGLILGEALPFARSYRCVARPKR